MKRKRLPYLFSAASLFFLVSCSSVGEELHPVLNVGQDGQDSAENSSSSPADDSSLLSSDGSFDSSTSGDSVSSSSQEEEPDPEWISFGRLPFEKLRYLSEMPEETESYDLSLRDVSSNLNAYSNTPSMLTNAYPSRLAVATIPVPEEETEGEEEDSLNYVLFDYVDGRLIETYTVKTLPSDSPISIHPTLPLAIVDQDGRYSLVDLAGNYLVSYLKARPTPENIVVRKIGEKTVYDFSLTDESFGTKYYESYLDKGCYVFKEISASLFPTDGNFTPLTDLHINSKGYYRQDGEDLILYGPEKNYLNRIVPSSFPLNEEAVQFRNVIHTDSAIYYIYTEFSEYSGYYTYAYGVDIATGEVSVAYGLPYVILSQKDYRKIYGDSYVYDGALLSVCRLVDGLPVIYPSLLSVDETISPLDIYDYDPIYAEGKFYQIGSEIVATIDGDFFVLHEDGTTELVPGVEAILHQDGESVIYRDELSRVREASNEDFLSGKGKSLPDYDGITTDRINGERVGYQVFGGKGTTQKGTFDAKWLDLAKEGLLVEEEEGKEEGDDGSFAISLFGGDRVFSSNGKLLSIDSIATPGLDDELLSVRYSYKGHSYTDYLLLQREATE